MKINLVKSKCSLEQSSNLVLLGKQIITNTRTNLVVLNHNLANVGTIRLPIKDFWINAGYVGLSKKSAIFVHNDGDERLIYFDVSNQKMSRIRGKELRYVYLCSDYLWVDKQCIIVARYRKKREYCLLVVDTQAFTVELFPMSESEKLAPPLFNFLQKKQQYQSVVEASLQQKFIVLADYYDEQTLTFINTDTDKSRVISIKKELDEGKIDKAGYYWPESTPHGVYYQDEWIVLVWEARVVIISPTGKQKTINEIEAFRFGYVRIVSTSEKSIRFFISLEIATQFAMLFILNKRCGPSSIVQAYEVSEE